MYSRDASTVLYHRKSKRDTQRGIARRARIIAAPGFVAPLLPVRALVQRFVDVRMQTNLTTALAIAREENAPLTTAQPR